MKAQNTSIRNISQVLFLFITGMALSADAMAQCKTYKIINNGDTVNCTDKKNRKQGIWIDRVNPLRGSPGYEEEGAYINDRKEGLWKKYTLQGDVLSMENYKWGLQNGVSQYFTVDGLERQEMWKALDPDKEYDTIDVPDLYQDGVVKSVIIKNEGYSLKHGKWTYYEPKTGFVSKTESWFKDSLENPLAIFGVKKKQPLSDTAAASLKKKALAVKTKEILDWEKKNAGKKKIKVRDGSTGY